MEGLGVYAKASKMIEKAGVEVCELDGVAENPRVSSVREGGRICREKGCDAVIAVGGGSGIDCAKAIAIAAVNDGDIWEYFENRRTATRALPIGAVSTIAATGAELSVHCVITNDEKRLKLAVHYPFTLPRFSIIDPALHTTVPRRATARGMADIISHVAESYFENGGRTLSDGIAESIMQTVLESESVLDVPEDIERREALAWAAALAISGLADCGRYNGVYVAHEISHGVTAICNTAHGEAIAVVHPAWLIHQCAKGVNLDKFAMFAKRVFGISPAINRDRGAGLLAIEALKNRYKSWGLPGSIGELGIGEDKLGAIARSAVSNPISPVDDYDEVMEVLKSCL